MTEIRRSIAFVTCADKKAGTADDLLVAKVLEARGWKVDFVTWSDSAVNWSLYVAAILRSPWDYHRSLRRFLEWTKLASTQTRLLNSREVVEWNSSKHYLMEIAKNLPAIPTVVCDPLDPSLTAASYLLERMDEIVVKPAVSATADLTFRVRDLDEAAKAIEAASIKGDVLAQPFLPSILEDGEVSLILFQVGGQFRFSHAVLKRGKKGDFRVQSEFGGTVEAFEPPATMIALALKSVAWLPGAALYARVDLVDWRTEPLIGELELIEPELFFRFSEAGISMMVQAIESTIISS